MRSAQDSAEAVEASATAVKTPTNRPFVKSLGMGTIVQRIAFHVKTWNAVVCCFHYWEKGSSGEREFFAIYIFIIGSSAGFHLH